MCELSIKKGGEGALVSEGGSPGEGHVPYTDPEGSGKRLTGHV